MVQRYREGLLNCHALQHAVLFRANVHIEKSARICASLLFCSKGAFRMTNKAELMDESAVKRSIARITHEIIERYRGVENLVLVGIKRRGLPIAKMIADNINRFENVSVPVGYIDITLYRDDISEASTEPQMSDSSLPVDINGKCVILVDDVIYTGRTARAAIECIFSHGRPASIGLAVLVDRGHRELPLRPDFVGKNIPTSKSEVIAVRVPEFDGETCVLLCDASLG